MEPVSTDSAPPLKFPTFEEYISTYIRRQKFSLPYLIMDYIIKNPSSPKVYQKLIKSCKHFFIKNPILIIPCLSLKEDRCKFASVDDVQPSKFPHLYHPIDLKNISSKLWLTNGLYVYVTPSSTCSNLIGKLYKCDVKWLKLVQQTITFDDFLFLSRKVEHMSIDRTDILTSDGKQVVLEKIYETLPGLVEIYWQGPPKSVTITAKTMKELLSFPHFMRLQRLVLQSLTQEFDVDSCYGFFKVNQQIKLNLSYRGDEELDEEYKEKLENIMDDILARDVHCFKPPSIRFPGEDVIKQWALHYIHEKFL
jgi:hypothetical protein